MKILVIYQDEPTGKSILLVDKIAGPFMDESIAREICEHEFPQHHYDIFDLYTPADYGLKIGVIVENGIVSEMRANVPIENLIVADLDVFDTCGGTLETACAPEEMDGEEHNDIRRRHKEIETLPFSDSEPVKNTKEDH